MVGERDGDATARAVSSAFVDLRDEPEWVKSTFSYIECVQLASMEGFVRVHGVFGDGPSPAFRAHRIEHLDEMIAISDSKDPTGPSLLITRAGLSYLLERIKAGDLDPLLPDQTPRPTDE